MKHKSITILFALTMIATIIFSTPQVHAATDIQGRKYTTWMQIDDNILFTSREREFYGGRNVLQISFDEWNSSICRSSSDQSYVTINLVENQVNRNIGVKTLRTKLNLCTQTTFGTISYGHYVYYFATFDTNQNKYCGYKSNYIEKRSDAQ